MLSNVLHHIPSATSQNLLETKPNDDTSGDEEDSEESEED